jgi:hypothetical protein
MGSAFDQEGRRFSCSGYAYKQGTFPEAIWQAYGELVTTFNERSGQT